jgi:hypothetical protein
LGVVERLLGRSLCRLHREAREGTRDQARARYLGALTAFDLVATLTPSEEQTLRDTQPVTVGAEWLARVSRSAVSYLLDQALVDDVLSADEDAAIARLSSLAGVDVADLVQTTPGLSPRVAVARINSGRLPAVAKPATRVRRREVAYFETRASLMTEAGGAAERI